MTTTMTRRRMKMKKSRCPTISTKKYWHRIGGVDRLSISLVMTQRVVISTFLQGVSILRKFRFDLFRLLYPLFLFEGVPLLRYASLLRFSLFYPRRSLLLLFDGVHFPLFRRRFLRLRCFLLLFCFLENLEAQLSMSE
jgi:hypothetical protein